MRKLLFAAAAALLATRAFCADTKPPEGWKFIGAPADTVKCGLDFEVFHSGHSSAFIFVPPDAPPNASGVLMQYLAADDHRGKRVRWSGWIKSRDVNLINPGACSGLWLRIDGSSSGKSLGLDNMTNRPVKGTTDWKQYSCVLDVPQEAEGIAVGALLTAPGGIWADDFKLEEVGPDVPVTNLLAKTGPTLPKEPANLDCELLPPQK